MLSCVDVGSINGCWVAVNANNFSLFKRLPTQERKHPTATSNIKYVLDSLISLHFLKHFNKIEQVLLISGHPNFALLIDGDPKTFNFDTFFHILLFGLKLGFFLIGLEDHIMLVFILYNAYKLKPITDLCVDFTVHVEKLLWKFTVAKGFLVLLLDFALDWRDFLTLVYLRNLFW